MYSSANDAKSDIGVVGLAVMGENLILNFASRGLTVSCHNRTTLKITEFIGGRAEGKSIVGCETLETLVSSLKAPRKIMLMVKAGPVVDLYIEKLSKLLSPGDILIDGGNSNFNDTTRRVAALTESGIHFLGCGVSGGEEGALLGPSIMPGGDVGGWEAVRPLLQAISAKVTDANVPCCEWIGAGGSGHYVKTVHNGIEYGDIQLICEAYHILKTTLGLGNDELADIFEEWNTGILDSYLIEITRDILRKRDEKNQDGWVVDQILDTAGQKGTGKWTAISALELGMPVTLIGEAVFARCLSAQKDERVHASTILPGPPATEFKGDAKAFITDVRDALFASKLVSYAQGFVLIKKASDEYKWNINYGSVALMWRGGCIIRSRFLGDIKAAFDTNPELDNLLLSDYFVQALTSCQAGWRRTLGYAVASGTPCPAFASALAYYDGYRTARLPANLLQAQRDYFGAHQYERLDAPRGQKFHTNWTGRGGTTASGVYNI
jgi:6-phosphogluconate dehydrogenase